jgi:hypothetical protein
MSGARLLRSFLLLVELGSVAACGGQSSPGAVTTASPPGAPTGVTAIAGNGQATVSWTAPTSVGSSPITGYVVTVSPGDLTAGASPTQSSAVVVGLMNGKTYTFTVHATNDAGSGPESARSNAVQPAMPAPPGAPRNVAAVAGDARATVTWDTPVSPGSGPITGYTVTASPGPLTMKVGASTTSAVVVGTLNGTGYTFTVHATNAAGDGPESLPSNRVTPAAPVPPGAPTSVTATAGDAWAAVTWTAPASQGSSAITGYVVTSSPGGLTVTAGADATGTVVTGLTNGTTFTFTVHATNAAGSGPESSASNAVTPLAPAPPGAPLGVLAYAGNAQALVMWTAPAAGSGAITGYTVTSSPGGLTTAAGPAATSAVVTGLTNGTPYTFSVRATNAVGDGPSSSPSNVVIPFMPVPPGAPQGVSAVGGNGKATVTWTAPADPGNSPISSYTVTASPGGVSVLAAASATSVDVTGLTNGTTYTFTVHATSGAGAGPESSPSNAVTCEAPPACSAGAGPPLGYGWCSAGKLFCSSNNACCPPGLPYHCASLSYCYATQAAATAACGATCDVCGSCGRAGLACCSSGALCGPGLTCTSGTCSGVVPGAPQNIAATAGDMKATVFWTAPASAGSAGITSFTVTSSPGGLTAKASATATSAAVKGLSNGTAYTFTVHATSGAGDGPESVASNAVTCATGPSCAAGGAVIPPGYAGAPAGQLLCTIDSSTWKWCSNANPYYCVGNNWCYPTAAGASAACGAACLACDTCGAEGQACCPSGSQCVPGFACVDGNCTSAAPTCGDLGQACCATGPACGTGLLCAGGTCGGATAFTGRLLFEQVVPDSATKPTGWLATPVKTPAAGFLVLSKNGTTIYDSTYTATGTGAGTFTVLVPSTPAAGDTIAFVAAELDAFGLVAAVADPVFATAGLHQAIYDVPANPRLWSWSLPVSAAQPGDLLIKLASAAGAASVFNDVQRGRRATWAYNHHAYPPDSRLIVWLGLSPATDWDCGACFAEYPATVFGVPFDTQMWIGVTADQGYWSGPVVVHETGHWVMASYGQTPNEGGPHYFGVPTFPGQAWSEGWATFFSSDARGSPVYWDKQQGAMFWIDLQNRGYSGGLTWQRPVPSDGLTSKPPASGLDENEVAAMLWKLDSSALAAQAVFDGLKSARLTQSPYARGYTRHTWDIDAKGNISNIVDTHESAPCLADFLDALDCAGFSRTGIDAATEPATHYPYPSNTPVCP